MFSVVRTRICTKRKGKRRSKKRLKSKLQGYFSFYESFFGTAKSHYVQPARLGLGKQTIFRSCGRGDIGSPQYAVDQKGQCNIIINACLKETKD